GIALCELGEMRADNREPMLARALFEQAVERFKAVGAVHLWRPLFGLAQANDALGEHERSHQQALLAQGLVCRQLEVVPEGFDTGLLRAASAEIMAFDAKVPDTMAGDSGPHRTTDRATLAAQHRGIDAAVLRLLKHRTPADLATYADDVADELGQLDRLVRVHSASENVGLYPSLLMHADEAVRKQASALYASGAGLYDDFIGFRRRFPDAAAIRENTSRAHAELARVLARLGRRMELEERELHPLAPE
ncbi:MAG: hypothetical protein KUG77_25715, partial [Nannocystaceae bacterium]|nr:hypothetical protein [Nannocystaceae bacterium]